MTASTTAHGPNCALKAMGGAALLLVKVITGGSDWELWRVPS